jgi:hypothetical protein
LRFFYIEAADLCAFSMRADLSSLAFRGAFDMDDVLMLVLVAILLLAGWGLTRFCEHLSARGRS